MKRQITLILFILLLIFGSMAEARETLHEFSIADLKNSPDWETTLSGVSFYFGDQPHPPVHKSYGEYPTNKKTNAFNKSDLVACEWVALSALAQFHKRALSMGADAVINIESNYKHNRVRSDTHYACGAGNVVAGVAFVGEIVKLGSGSVSSVPASSPKPASKSSLGGKSDIREAQELLTKLGYDPGPADGIMGSRTSAALGVFQSSQGLTVTGSVNQETLGALRKEAGVEPEPSVEEAQASASEKLSGKANTTAKVELKSMADPFADSLVVIPKGGELEILKDGGEWLFVSFNGQKGYVYSEFVSQ